MRSVETPVKKIRREVFTEICKVAFESTKDNFNDEIEAIPYHIVKERASYRESILQGKERLPANVSALPWVCPCGRKMKPFTSLPEWKTAT